MLEIITLHIVLLFYLVVIAGDINHGVKMGDRNKQERRLSFFQDTDLYNVGELILEKGP